MSLLESRMAEFLKEKEDTIHEMNILLGEEPLDEDGYPTDAALRLIEIWWHDDVDGWFEYIRKIWHLASWGWHSEIVPHTFREDEKVTRYNISTAGWSGNESIIYAMEKNWMLWNKTWVQSRRGGHYIFEVEEEEE